jgi:hypothetical protein
VNLHVFNPDELESQVNRIGARDVAVVTEEFTAAMLGRPVRTFEGGRPGGKLSWGWAMFAYSSRQRLSSLNRSVLRGVVPRGVVLQRARDRDKAA